MSRRYIEIIPPGTPLPDSRHGAWTAATAVASDTSDGPMVSLFARARARRQARTLRAMAETMEAAKVYFDARRQAIESCIKAQEEEYRLESLPLRSGLEQARQGEEEWEKLRAVEHQSEIAEWQRGGELAEAQAALLAARQALEAQRDLGGELAWKRRQVDLLDIELAIAERRAVLRQHFEELSRAMGGAGARVGSAGALEDALHDARAQLNAHGLDTSAIDAILERRNRR